jgi:uncharacterized membrane protein YoaK (UPF0700 family)
MRSPIKLTSVPVQARKTAQQTTAFAQRLHVHYQNPPPTPFRRELLLTITTFQTGILDAATFITWGLFVSNMTGNVIFLGAAIAGFVVQHDITPSVVALISFFVGGFLTSLCGRLTHQPDTAHSAYSRYFFAGMSLIHCCLYLIGASLVSTDTVPITTTSSLRLIIFALLSMGQGSQIVLTRHAGLPEFTTAVVTSTIADFSANADFSHLVGKGWRAQIRRAASVIAIFVGAIVGGEVINHQDFGVAMFVAGGISFVIIFGWSL